MYGNYWCLQQQGHLQSDVRTQFGDRCKCNYFKLNVFDIRSSFGDYFKNVENTQFQYKKWIFGINLF